jgi:hypothetical protein
VALGPQIVDLLGLHLLYYADKVGAVGKVSVVEKETHPLLVRVHVEVVDPIGIKEARSTLDAVHLVVLAEQKLGQIRPVLAGDAGDEGFFGVSISFSC